MRRWCGHTSLMQRCSDTIGEGSLLAQRASTPVDELTATRVPMCLIHHCKSYQALLKDLPYVLQWSARGQTHTHTHTRAHACKHTSAQTIPAPLPKWHYASMGPRNRCKVLPLRHGRRVFKAQGFHFLNKAVYPIIVTSVHGLCGNNRL